MQVFKMLGVFAVVLGMMFTISNPVSAQDMSKGADNFFKSSKVTMQKRWRSKTNTT